jgi:hypothetical protein
MAFDIGGWISGAGSSVDKFLGGTGGEAIPAGTQQMTTDEYAMPSTQEVTAPVASPIPENYTNINSADEQGTYKAVITDTSTPATQNFVESYVDSAKTGSIDRIGYTRPEDIGDSRTQELVREGYSPLQATAMQREEKIAELVGKGYSREQAAESREALYYKNESKKATDSIDAMSASKHHDAMASGLPQSPNEFEHAGDLARQFGYKIEGVSNVPGTQKGDPLTVPFKGSFLTDANIITKTQRTGEMGDYKYLGKPFSSTFGTLDLLTQQAIGRQAAASALASGKEGPQSGWKVDERIMDKYTPELAKGAGFNLAYKEATFGGVGKSGSKDATANAVDIASGRGKAFQVEMEDGSMVTRYESDWNLFPQAKSLPALGMDKDAVVKSPGITAGTINDYLLPEDRVVVGGKSDYTVNVLPNFGGQVKNEDLKSNIVGKTAFEDASATNKLEIPDVSVNLGLPTTSVTGAKRTVDMTTAPPGNWMNRYTGGRSGGDVSVGGLDTKKILIPLRTPRGSAMDRGDFGFTIGGTQYRKPKRTVPIIKRIAKPDKKPYGMMTIDDHAILKNLGRDFFKFKVGTPDTLVKSNRARVNPVVNVNTDKLGLKQATKSTITLPKINIQNGKSNTSANINGILNRATKKVKSK